MKLFAGIFDLSTLSSEVATIVSAANGDWSSFDTISVGNELVNSGTASASAVVADIGTARTLLKAAGYTGKVVTVDTLVAARANPSLCDASDYCAVNCHPFFDGSYAATDSGKFLQDMIPTLQDVLSNKSQQIVITETGWPWKGDSNQKAVPSLENQAAAVSSIKAAFSSSPDAVFLFTAFNTLWKTSSSAQFDAEQYWGLDGRNSPSG
jgi:exo-beta-1,3-glucanase (GH17 family)